MPTSPADHNRRILVIDDNRAIHDDIRKILSPDQRGVAVLNEAEAALFGDASAGAAAKGFEIDSAYQGQEGLGLLRQALRAERPYAVAFVDGHMPPGWDGVMTIKRLWQEDPQLEVVVCTAYSDYSWEEMAQALGEIDHLLILKKPFDTVEVRQLAWALSEKRSLARRVRQAMDDLETAAQQRTRELQEQKEQLERTHAQLLHAQKLESIGRLAVGIAHEISQPLTAILGHAEAARLAAQPAPGIPRKILDDLEHVAAQAHRASEIVRRLKALVLTRKLNRFAVDPNQLIGEVLRGLEAEARASEVRLQLKLSVPVSPVSADPVHVRQVLLNLVRNAIEAMSQGEVCGGELVVQTRQTEGGMVEIAVGDTGPGVGEPMVDKLFEPFFSTKAGGMGMGLAISRSIIEAHGGRLWATANPDGGMTFRFTLPLFEAKENDEAREHGIRGR